MSAIATSTLIIVVICVAMLLTWWRTLLKILAVSVLVLTSIGTVEVVAAVIGGLTAN
jgi:hypothetical protein